MMKNYCHLTQEEKDQYKDWPEPEQKPEEDHSIPLSVAVAIINGDW